MFRCASIPLPLAGFGLELLTNQAELCGTTLPGFMERAAERYADGGTTDTPSRRVPRFVRDAAPRGPAYTVDVELSPDLWDVLECAAQEQDVSLEQMVLHVALLYAAELDASPPRR